MLVQNWNVGTNTNLSDACTSVATYGWLGLLSVVQQAYTAQLTARVVRTPPL